MMVQSYLPMGDLEDESDFGELRPPNPNPQHSEIARTEWINKVCDDFVATSPSLRNYYRVILETLWPEGHGIPGPWINREVIREAIDSFRRQNHKGYKVLKPYQDPFRRVRELQGEEGFFGIVKKGHNFQLINLDVQPKRTPREKLKDTDWAKVLNIYNHRCAVCLREAPKVGLGPFEQDHKIPRLRHGTNEIANWQPLCRECNNFKSTACRGCTLDCTECSWAFPEKFTPIKLSSENTLKLRELAERLNMDVHELSNYLIKQAIYDFEQAN